MNPIPEATELRVNGRTIGADAITREAAFHEGADDPNAAARRALAVRTLLLRRADELGLAEETETAPTREQEDALIAAVLDAEVRTPVPTDEECRRYFAAHPHQFTSGELVEARHILFAVTPGTPVMALRERAEAMLAELRADPRPFEERARAWSNCPSAACGGNLGQFGRGEMVPEFDGAIFGTAALGVLPRLVQTRYGFHIVEVARRLPGAALPYDLVGLAIAEHLAREVEARALVQYLRVLAGSAELSGVDLESATTPLVQ